MMVAPKLQTRPYVIRRITHWGNRVHWVLWAWEKSQGKYENRSIRHTREACLTDIALIEHRSLVMSLRKTTEELETAMRAALSVGKDPEEVALSELTLIFNNAETRRWLVEQNSFPAPAVAAVLDALGTVMYEQGLGRYGEES